MKKILSKKNLVFIFPFLALVITIIAVSTNKQINEEKIIQTSYEDDFSYKRIYLISEDNSLVVPLTTTCPKQNNIAQDMLCIINLLKENSKVTTTSGFTYTLGKDVKVNSIEIDQKIASIDFSNEFNNYEKKKEKKILESLVWSLSQFDEIDGLVIKVDGFILEKMPQDNTPLPPLLTKKIGINHYIGSADPYNTKPITLLYETTINELSYLVPITRRVTPQEDEVSTILKSLFLDIDYHTGLKEVSILPHIEINDYQLENDLLTLDLSDKALLEELCVKEEIYETLMLTFNELNQFEIEMNFTIDEEPAFVNNYYGNNQTQVSFVLINDVIL